MLVPSAFLRVFPGPAERSNVGQISAKAPRPGTPCQLRAPSLRGARIDRAERISVANQGGVARP